LADYAQHVNFSTLDNIKTTSRYDSDISKWVNDSALWHLNDAGILVATGYDNPLPTTLSGSNVGYKYGFVAGYSTGFIGGDTADWYALRNAVDVDATDVLNTLANMLTYFHTDGSVFNTTPVWVKIPIMASDFRNFIATIVNYLGVNMTVDAYAVPIKGQTWTGVQTNIAALISHQIVAAQVLADGDALAFGPGGVTLSAPSQWPIGWLVIKMTPASLPASNKNWRLAVMRSY